MSGDLLNQLLSPDLRLFPSIEKRCVLPAQLYVPLGIAARERVVGKIEDVIGFKIGVADFENR